MTSSSAGRDGALDPAGKNSTGDHGPRIDPEVFRLAVEKAPTPMIIVGRQGRMVAVNAAAEELFGYPAAELLGESVELLLPEAFRRVHQAHREEYMGDPHDRPMGELRDLHAVDREGSVIPVEVGLSPVDTPSGLMVVCSVVDLSARKAAADRMTEVVELLERQNERLLELVATDALTSLHSRRAFMDHLTAQLEVSVRHARPLSVLILDIDHFKEYNDEFGHLAGDEILEQMGEILESVARRSDFVARLGGEEFGVVLPETGQEGARTLAERFREKVEAADWPRRDITVSLGASTVDFPQKVPRPETPDLSSILRDADRALYASKRSGRNRSTHAEELASRN